MDMEGYVWSAVSDAPVRELFPGIRLRRLWHGDNGATAQVLEMDPNTCWEGQDVHEPGPEEDVQPLVSIAFYEGVHPTRGFDWALERFGLGERHLAVACASHGGSDTHVELVA